jgi:leader peptidase (prepilin peptidase)/N-methyltransferase
VELATAGLAVASLWVRGAAPGFLWTFGTGCVFLAVAWVDARHGLIPDVFVAAGLAIALAGAGWAGWPALWDAALGMVLGGGSFALLKRLYRAVRKQEGMGAGDVKLAALLGAALGAWGFLLAVVGGSAAGSAVGLWLVLTGRARWETPLPFGFFLALAGILILMLRHP